MTTNSATQPKVSQVMHRRITVDGINVFYREAGPSDAPTILLLHGFPSSSHMFRKLIPQLAQDFHLVAPDLPGFGFTELQSRGEFAYTFDNLAKVIERFTEAVSLTTYAIYVFDYGAAVGFRLAMAHPERVTAIISQNGNAYDEGLSTNWDAIQRYWREPTQEHRDAIRTLLTLEATKWQYVHGVADKARMAPSLGLWTSPCCSDRRSMRSNSTYSSIMARKHRTLPNVPRLFCEPSAAAAGCLGQERSVFSAGGCRSVQARHPGR